MDETTHQNPQTENATWETPTDSQPSEFVEKKPLISEKNQKKLIKSGISCIVLVLVLIGGYFLFKKLTASSIDSGPTPPPEIVDEPITNEVSRPMMAYVKNDKEVWVVDENGEGKSRIIEISPAVNQYISALDWYDMENLSYSRCDNAENVCNAETINLKNKAVTNEFKATGVIIKMAWSPDKNYISYIEDTGANLALRLKSGTVITMLSTYQQGPDPLNENARVFFTPDSQIIVWSGIKEETVDLRTLATINYPVIEAFRVNGAKLDDIPNGSYPMYFENNQIIYTRNNQLVYRVLGRSDDSAITPINGKNPRLSPDKTEIAYWRFENELSNIILGLYDSELDIHKNILRGIVFPIWINDNKIAGIEIRNCQTERCELYEFQTNNLVILDISRDSVLQIDQGRSISNIVYFDKQTNTQ